jgi:BirA family biotin operon repressor/biotin-[acetyl-CoA-carboxylase] ligase
MRRAAAPASAARTAQGQDSPLVARVFALLSDGRFHSGEDLAHTLGVSRSAVWKAAAALKELGATLHAVRNRGYQLPRTGEPLDTRALRESLPKDVRSHVTRIDAAWSVPSTNSELLARPNPPDGACEVLLAEYQSAGRGRRGRAWLAPPGGAICLSLSWTFQESPQDLGALGLVIGVCTLRALRAQGIADAQLKWPNDLLVADQKLGGILIELRAESAGPACVIIGIGLNVALGKELLTTIAATGTTATDLSSAAGQVPSRNDVAASLVACCVRGLMQFAQAGFVPFLEEWKTADALIGRSVTVTAGDNTTKGVARGIDLHGALLIQTPQGVQRFVSGDVTVRAS